MVTGPFVTRHAANALFLLYTDCEARITITDQGRIWARIVTLGQVTK